VLVDEGEEVEGVGVRGFGGEDFPVEGDGRGELAGAVVAQGAFEERGGGRHRAWMEAGKAGRRKRAGEVWIP